jgi:ankyrin repeat protein
MQNDFSDSALKTNAELGRELISEILKPDRGDICDHAKCLRLIEQRASLEIPSEDDMNSGEIALTGTMRLGQDDIAKALIEAGANLDARDSSGNNALMCAAVYDRPEMLKLLIEKGSPLDEQNQEGHTALIWAGYWDKPDIAEILIRAGADANIRHSTGRTAVEWAMTNGHPETAQIIREAVEEREERVERERMKREQEQSDAWEAFRAQGLPTQQPVKIGRPLVLKRSAF